MPSDDIARLYDFTAGTAIQSSQVDGEFNQIVTAANGKAGRAVDNTMSGNNTNSGTNIHSGANSFTHATTPILTDKIVEYTATTGVTIDSVLHKDGFVRVNAGASYTPTVAAEIGYDTTTGLFKTYSSASKPVCLNGGVRRSTATSDTILAADRNVTVVYASTAAVAVTLPQAGSTGFTDNFTCSIVSAGAGGVTITPTTSTIDTASSLALAVNQGTKLYASTANNYHTVRGLSGVTAAVQADQETGTSTTTFVNPGVQQNHPSACKAWVSYTGVTTTAIESSYNITSLTDQGSGDTTITIATDFSDANYCASGMVECVTTSDGQNIIDIRTGGQAAGTLRVTSKSAAGTLTDLPTNCVSMFGDQ